MIGFWQKRWRKGTFHHYIALFCTVSANLPLANSRLTIFYNEINDLGQDLKVRIKNLFYINDLEFILKVILEDLADRIAIWVRRTNSKTLAWYRSQAGGPTSKPVAGAGQSMLCIGLSAPIACIEPRRDR